MTLARFWRVEEEKSDILLPGGSIWVEHNQRIRKNSSVQAVQLFETSGKSKTQVARDLGMSDSALSKWCKEYGDRKEEAFPGKGHQTPVEEEIRQLRRENEVLRQEREILKKAMSIFTQPRL
jgi:transposase